MTKRFKVAVPMILLVAALGLVACGGDDGDSTSDAPTVATPEEAITEVGLTQDGLATALDTYQSGDATAAADQVSETYLEHFEIVEGPLEEVDSELTEELEEQIRENLVASIEAGDPVADVSKLVDEIDAGLEQATSVLEGS